MTNFTKIPSDLFRIISDYDGREIAIKSQNSMSLKKAMHKKIRTNKCMHCDTTIKTFIWVCDECIDGCVCEKIRKKYCGVMGGKCGTYCDWCAI